MYQISIKGLETYKEAAKNTHNSYLEMFNHQLDKNVGILGFQNQKELGEANDPPHNSRVSRSETNCLEKG